MTSPIVVMGVSGSGKSTVGAALAQRLRVPFADADDFHPPANIAKMTAGHALDDDDRYPWLEAIGEWLADAPRRRGDELLGAQAQVPRPTPSALPGRRVPAPEWLARGRSARRQASRPGHFMPASLLASQFETLEPLEADERGIAIDVDQSIDSIVEELRCPRTDRRARMSSSSTTILADAPKLAQPVASGWQLILAFLAGIAVIVVLITWSSCIRSWP